MTATYEPNTPLSPEEFATVERFGFGPSLLRKPPRDPWWWYPIQGVVLVVLVVTAPVWIVGLVVFAAYADRRIQ